jgi:cysteine synthase
MMTLEIPTADDIRAARERIAPFATRTPLIRLPALAGEREIWLKLETLQPIGSFKIRGAANALAQVPPEELARGVYTASAGNMAQGVAWCARAAGVPCAVVVPDSAPRAKLDAVERLGARVIPLPYERWWRVLVERHYESLDGFFVHPVSDAAVIAGNGTVGLEIAEDLPQVATVLVPYGGGGLACGIAAALREAAPRARVFGCEVETATPLAASLEAGAARASGQLRGRDRRALDAGGDVAAGRAAAGGILCRVAGGNRERHPRAGRPRPGRCRGRWRLIARGGVRRPPRDRCRRHTRAAARRAACVRHLRRQHRPRQAGDDSRGTPALGEKRPAPWSS